MALVREKGTKVEGDLGGRKIEMQLDVNSLAHIIGAIANLYSDILKAIVRELCTNAIDSHLEAGQTRPVSITTPTAFSPMLKIQDWGVGMNVEDIEKVWGMVGASTKRNSNVAAGQLGFGSKSPLAYGSRSMTIEAIKDGIKTLAVTGADSKFGGMIEILSETETDQPNGYMVSIPVNNRNDHHRFKEVALEFQKYSKFPVLVDGKTYRDDSTWIGDRFREFDTSFRQWNAKDVVVMGNVAYPITDRERLHRSKTIAMYVDMNEVDFAPSREDLQYTIHTKEALDRYAIMYFEEKIKEDQKYIDRKTSHATAYNESRIRLNDYPYEYREKISFTYKGLDVPYTLFQGQHVHWDYYNSDYEKVGRSGPQSMSPNHEAPLTGNYVILYNYTNKSFTKNHLLKVMKYAEENDFGVRSIYTTEHDNSDGQFIWFSVERFVDWNDIKLVKIAGAVKKKGKQEKQWEGVGGDHKTLSMFVPDKSKKIYYTSRTDQKQVYWGLDPNELSKYTSDDVQIMLVVESQREKFLKLYPSAEPIENLAKALINEYLLNLTQEDRDLIEKFDSYNEISMNVDPDRIDDPDLRALIVSNKVGRESAIAKNDRFDRLAFQIQDSSEKTLYRQRIPQEGTRKATNVREKYPYLPWYVTDDMVDHAVTYVNAIYKSLNP